MKNSSDWECSLNFLLISAKPVFEPTFQSMNLESRSLDIYVAGVG
jgi:hypothetical protein